MSTQETVRVFVEMIFTTDAGEVPDDTELEALISSQMSGELDEATGLGCMAVEVTDRTGCLDEKPCILVSPRRCRP